MLTISSKSSNAERVVLQFVNSHREAKADDKSSMIEKRFFFHFMIVGGIYIIVQLLKVIKNCARVSRVAVAMNHAVTLFHPFIVYFH